LILFALGGALAGCNSDQPGTRAGNSDAEPPASASAEADVAILGREVFDLVDRAMSYRSAHRGRLPRDLRELGIDALTPTTSRSLSVSGNVPTVTVGFRTTEGHVVRDCRGTNALLEESTLAGGQFSLICNLVAGGTTTLKAQR
jgi:hypothetical protein